jgi:hypothetical protein
LRVLAREQHVGGERRAAAGGEAHDGQVEARKRIDRRACAQPVWRGVEALREDGRAQRLG